MNLFRLAQTAGLLSLMAAGFTSCLTAPSYSTTPEISFNSIKHDRYNINGGLVDSILVTINFQDGDGDLGLTATEGTSAPYTPTYYGANFYATPFVKTAQTGGFDSLKNARPMLQLRKNYLYERFDHPSTTTDNRAAPLRGTLKRSYRFVPGSQFLPGDEVKFRISIFDRALHRSNEIETTSIIIP
jgi:hypothetical protein